MYMCGIAGIYKFNQDKVLLKDLKIMTDAIVHRGPDGEGHWLSESNKVGFGHRRLSIIDLSENAKQPMHYANQRYTITFNGEIYNYLEIRKFLCDKGYCFNSESDTEVLMALYDLKKENCLEDLDGMFSFAIWDEQEQVLFCARDRFGEKPFHYYYDNEKFIFASEIKQFWSIGITKKISQKRLMQFVDFGTIDDAHNLSDTFYEGIKRLDAAHYLIVKPNHSISIHQYWKINLSAPKFNGTIEQAAERFLELFIESIKIRLRSDVPLGSSLSGGLDSSSIVMLIDALKGKELKQNTFSARFKNFEKDEGIFIEEVSKSCENLKVHYTWPNKEYFENVFDKVTYHQDEPYGSASIVAQYAVMELAKQNQVTVLLDGQGADEQLAGYLPYYHAYLNYLFFHNTPKYEIEYSAYLKYHQNASPYHTIQDSETWRMKLGRYRRRLLQQEMPYDSNLNSKLNLSTTKVGLKELLRYADRNSMAHSREVRLPFLSHKLVEFVFSLPDDYKLNNGWTKFILRKSMNNILPSSICWRVDKIGYEPPQSNWLNSEKIKLDIENSRKILGVKSKGGSNLNFIFNEEWRLLMASKFI